MVTWRKGIDEGKVVGKCPMCDADVVVKKIRKDDIHVECVEGHYGEDRVADTDV